MPGLRRRPGVGARAPPPVGVCRLSPADLGDRRRGGARDSHAVAGVVLGRHLVATHHPRVSAKQLQRQLGLSRYETAWLILQKLRRAIVASERARLKNVVEVDEFFLGGSLAGSWEWSVCSRSRREQ